MKRYPLFYRQHGIRRVSQLMQPSLSDYESLHLPFNSLLHYVGEDEDIGLDEDDPMVADAKRVFVEHVTDLYSDEGNPRERPGAKEEKLARQYRKQNRKILRARSGVENIDDERTVVVENYALLHHLYFYRERPLSEWHEWMNMQRTVFHRANKINEKTDRNQFLFLQLPDKLPTRSQLRKAERNPTREVLRDFMEDADAMAMLDVWTWLGEEREKSAMSLLDDRAANNLNLIWMCAGKWVVLNAGLLNSWRAGGEDERNEEQGSGSEDPKMLQNKFLRMLLTLHETKTASSVTNVDPEFIEPEEEVEDESEAQIEGDELETVEESPYEQAIEPDDEAPTLDEEEEEEQRLEKQLQEMDEETQLQEAGAVEQTLEERMEAAQYHPPDKDLSKAVENRSRELVEAGLLSSAQHQRFKKLANKYKDIDNPFGEGTLDEFRAISQEDIKIEGSTKLPSSDAVTDKSMEKTTLQDFDRRYTENILPKDVVNSILNVQKMGVAVTSVEVEREENALNHYDSYALQLTPPSGRPSTVHFRIPVVDEDGTFKADGVKYRLRKQRVDVPIRKTAPTRVALTSYHSKMFVERAQRTTFNYSKWLTNNISAKALDDEDNKVQAPQYSNVFYHEASLPMAYTAMASRFRAITVGGWKFFFDFENRNEHFGEKNVEKFEDDNHVVVATKGKEFLLMDMGAGLIRVDEKGNFKDAGTFEELAGLDLSKRPIPMVEVSVFNKAIPVVFLLGHEMGLAALLKRLGVTPRRVDKGKRMNLQADEYPIRFADQTLIFSMKDRIASMVVAGFNRFHQYVKRLNVVDFEKKDAYFNVLEDVGIGLRYVREFDIIFTMFIDPITEELLEEINEPTNMADLYIRCCELLLTDEHPKETDMRHMRIRGYERFAGKVYNQLSSALRVFNAKPATAKAQIDLNPNAVWMSVLEDPAKVLVQESNPIHNLKEKEVVTFSGEGGRSTQSMPGRVRVFHENDMGVISESTPDSQNVAVVTYLSHDPNLNSLRGTTNRYDKEKDGPGRILSPSALLSPAADMDDPKRVNFINIQNSQNVYCKGAKLSPLRTGYEQIMAHRVDDLFAHTAKENGKVVEKSDEHIVVEYKSGERKHIKLGRRFGRVPGTVLPHEVVTDLEEGDSVKEGDVVTWNKRYFEKEFHDPKTVSYKAGLIVTTAIMESTETFEDSSAINQRVAEELSTEITHERDIVLASDQNVDGLVKVGDVVDVETILCTIHDNIASEEELFDEQTLATLQSISSTTPKAKHQGVVEKIEVYYNGDKEDMSESLRKIADRSDKQLAKEAKNMGKEAFSGGVDSTMRVGGNPLALDTLVVRVYITGEVDAGVGDKGVFANQMKSVFARVMEGVNETESGEPVEAFFGYKSISDRIVLSPEVIGTTNTLLRVLSKHIAQVYRGEK